MRWVAFAVCLVTMPVLAADPDPKKAAEEAFHAKDYKTALARYVEIWKVTKDPAILYNIARCHQELGDYPAAYDHYTRFAVEAPVALRAKVPHLDEKIAFVASHTVVIKIVANVVGAAVTIDGKVVGESGSLEPVRVNAGTIAISASKQGYFDDKKSVEGKGGATITVKLELAERVMSGVLRVQTNVDATVTVDDKIAGRAPVELVVPAGAHRIVVSADGRKTWSDTVLVPAGGTRTQTVTLASESSHWWIWAGAGVVVAGGAVLTYALLTEKKADHGSFTPGQVATGLLRF